MIENFSLGFFLKTTDGGMNWTSTTINGQSNLEGIGFINETTGWIGGWGQNYNMPTIRTTNGGVSWHAAGWGINVNRFRFISDTLAYAVGTRIFKYMRLPVGIQPSATEVPEEISLSQNYPNPFNPVTTIKYTLWYVDHIKLTVYDAKGNAVALVIDEEQSAGRHSAKFDASNLASGIYYYKLESNQLQDTRKMVLIK